MRRCPHICTPPLIALCALLLAACSTEPRVIAVRRYNGASPPPQRPAERPGDYRVVAGDTLYSIAFRHQMDYRELARINGITAPYTIYPGQELRLHAAAGQYAPAASTRVVSRAPPRATASTGAREGAVIAASVPAPSGSAGGSAAWPAPPPGMSSQTRPGSVAPATGSAMGNASPVIAGAGPTRTVDGITWRWPVEGRVLDGFQADEPGRQGLDIGGRMGQPVYAAASGVVVYSGSGLTGYGELVIVKHNDDYLSAYGHNSVRLVKEGQKVVAGQEIAEMGNSGAPRVELHFEIRKDGRPLNPLDFLPKR